MTNQQYYKAKAIITLACNQTELDFPDLVGVLSAILADAREQMAFQLAGEVAQLKEKINSKEAEDNGDSE